MRLLHSAGNGTPKALGYLGKVRQYIPTLGKNLLAHKKAGEEKTSPAG